MHFWRRAALMAVLLAVVSGCGGAPGLGLLGRQYEYEEDLTLSIDGSATLIVNTSIPALDALRGVQLSADSKTRVDTARLRELFSSADVQVVRITTWSRKGRRFAGIRLRVPDVTALYKSPMFSWERITMGIEGTTRIYRDQLGPSAFTPGTLTNVGWDGSEIVAFRLHLPSRIDWHNARSADDQPNDVGRGNILTWEQRLTDRLDNRPIAYAQDKTPGVMEVHMDSQSILHRTLYLFAIAFAAAVGVLVLLIWLTMRRGRHEDESA